MGKLGFGSLSWEENTPEFLQTLSYARGKIRKSNFDTTWWHFVTKILETQWRTITVNWVSKLMFWSIEEIKRFFWIDERYFWELVDNIFIEDKLRNLNASEKQFWSEELIRFYSLWFEEVILWKLTDKPSIDNILEVFEWLKELDIITWKEISKKIIDDLSFILIHNKLWFHWDDDEWKQLDEEDKKEYLNWITQEKIHSFLEDIKEQFLFLIRRFLFSDEIYSSIEDLRKKLISLVEVDYTKIRTIKSWFNKNALRSWRTV